MQVQTAGTRGVRRNVLDGKEPLIILAAGRVDTEPFLAHLAAVGAARTALAALPENQTQQGLDDGVGAAVGVQRELLSHALKAVHAVKTRNLTRIQLTTNQVKFDEKSDTKVKKTISYLSIDRREAEQKNAKRAFANLHAL